MPIHTMRSFPIVIVLFLVVILPPGLFADEKAATEKATGPRIEFSEPVYDFKKVKSSDVLRHEFTVTNTGDAPLEIWEVKPGCGCTTAGDWDPVVLPHHSATIPIV